MSSDSNLKYSELSLHEHVLHRPDTYVGSIASVSEECYLSMLKDSSMFIQSLNIEYVPAIHRLFLEALANCVDHAQRSVEHEVPFKLIKVSLNGHRLEFTNDGLCLPVIQNDSLEWVPTMLFGKLLTSSNYHDDATRIVAGKNGLGIKCANIFSNHFTVEIGDPIRQLLFKQEWQNHMNTVSSASIKVYKRKTAYVKISYCVDFSYFGLSEGYTENDVALFEKYLIDASLHLPVPVVWHCPERHENPVKIRTVGLEEYVNYYIQETCHRIVLKNVQSTCVIVDVPGFEISFVNGIYTPKGGIHIDSYYQEVYKILKTCSATKQMTFKQFRQEVSLFVSCRVVNPQFQSQTKEILTSPRPCIHFDEKDDRKIRKMTKWNFVSVLRKKEIVKDNLLGLKEERKRVKIEGLSPAIKTGVKSSLFITEGQSAKTYATQGIHEGMMTPMGECKGPTYFGVYAVRGKPVNVRGLTLKQALENREVHDIISAVGVQSGIDYTLEHHYKKLRYGRIICLCDADNDGYHIVALLLNIFDVFYPSLLQRPFFYMMCTPIMAIETRQDIHRFYTKSDAKQAISNLSQVRRVFYYKGLGTSTNKDIRATFGKCIVQLMYDENASSAMDTIFHKQKSNERKTWLIERLSNRHCEPSRQQGPLPNIKFQSVSNFLHTQLIEFSLEDCYRSLPHLLDGLKQSQRKVLFASLCKKQRMKVMQLAGYVSERTCYHHGEMNLFGTITKMAQSFVGSNNLPLLVPDGQFGSRLAGGKDSANARYIYTSLQPYTSLLFPAEDDALYSYEQDDDGGPIEPSYYIPILPMILVNGCISGIGTGFSCNVLSYHPRQLMQQIRATLHNQSREAMSPYYHGFQGTIVQETDTKYRTEGVYHIEKIGTREFMVITELPIGCWTDVFIGKLEKLEDTRRIRRIENYSTPQNVHIRIEIDQQGEEMVKKLLYQHIHASNMVLFDKHNIPRHFKTVDDVFQYYFQERYELYTKRIQHCLKQFQNELRFLQSKKHFLTNRPKHATETQCLHWCEQEVLIEPKNGGYDYLLNLPIRATLQLTQLETKISDCQKQIAYYETCSVRDLWCKELDSLEHSLNKCEKKS